MNTDPRDALRRQVRALADLIEALPAPAPPDAALLGPPAIAARCQISLRSARRLLASSALPVIEIPGAGTRPLRRVRATDLEQYLAHCLRPTAARVATPLRTFTARTRRAMRN